MRKNRPNDHLGLNSMGKNIRKSPLNRPNLDNPTTIRPQSHPQPQVYKISKNDFRNIVQKLTGIPSRQPMPRPPENHSKPSSVRLRRIRLPPLVPINPPHVLPPSQGSPPHNTIPLVPESPISAYMRYLQSSIVDTGPRQAIEQPRQPALASGQFQGEIQNQPWLTGLLPNPSPTSRFLLPSPTGFPNMFSPHSPYPLLYPGYHYSPQSKTPNFTFSSISQPGILGPVSHQPPLPDGFSHHLPRVPYHLQVQGEEVTFLNVAKNLLRNIKSLGVWLIETS